MAPTDTYLICATQRSGSTLLCELLKQTGVAGRPEEYFDAQFEGWIAPASAASAIFAKSCSFDSVDLRGHAS